MECANVIAIVDAPEISLTESEKAGDVLLKFYRTLGWNGEDTIDPRKIITTKAVFNHLYDTMFERCPDSVGVGMTMVNSGPSTDDCVPHGKVYLLKGWITPIEPKEDGANET